MISNLRITKLPDEPDDRHGAARSYCLKIIKDFYDIDYTSAWHADLDSLITSSRTNWYSSLNQGAFWLCQNEAGDILGTCGIYNMKWKPGTLNRLISYYSDGAAVCQLSRMYIREDLRGHGIGRRLEAYAASEAGALNYRDIYLHADSRALSTLAFWDACGYVRLGFENELQIIDYNKKLHPEGCSFPLIDIIS